MNIYQYDVTNEQWAFDLLCSLVERQKQTGDFDEHPVWDTAEEFCHRLRDEGMIRVKYLSDYVPSAVYLEE